MNIIHSIILFFKSNYNLINDLKKRLRNNNQLYSAHNDIIRLL